MYLDPEGSVTDNEGPHCRNCHTGASSCNQCHGLETGGVANANWGTTLLAAGANKSVFAGDAFAHTTAVTTVANECLDGGFSFPHRTLGKDLLKDELYGVNFDGSYVNVGDTRSTTLSDGSTVLDTANYPLAWARSETSEIATTNPTTAGDPSVMVWESGEQITNVGGVENLDSVCIDCHGNATVWNGDNPATFKDPVKGWELLWKGLP